eukprot:CAMPEP_0119030510 /NCGR_PEP_ID=MMETSP1176-20130426/41066_1 /TAXON_ID=265551 /ORGANISM="Synedropsis recta cf, Strain CCMP1620" /LENGTH=463 /DNA_ID=CAMNT_0006986881 /DNA_START=17 /DNA_END=1406 /DNA_ORIENTATION=-
MSSDQSGAINEKVRTFVSNSTTTEAQQQQQQQQNKKKQEANDAGSDDSNTGTAAFSHNSKAHLLHALEGLDRYPNYLNRWNKDDDLDELELALEQQLTKVRQQRQVNTERRAAIAALVLRSSSIDDDDDDDEQQRQVNTERRAAIAALVLRSSSIDDDDDDDDNAMSSQLLTIQQLQQPPTSWDDVKQLLSPALVKAIFQSRQFRSKKKQPPPTVEQVLAGQVAVELDPHLLEQLMEQEVYDVYSFPLFHESVCDALRHCTTILKSQDMQEVYDVYAFPLFHESVCDALRHCTTILKSQDNGNDDASILSKRPIDLDTIGLGWINDLLLHLVVRPISRHLYQDTECAGGDLDWRQGYVASYEAVTPTTSSSSNSKAGSGGRNRLVAHTDDSEVTLNIGLGQDFEGGLLEFHGLRGDANHQELIGDAYEPVKGRAVLHAGRHFHQVTQVTKGHRFALILWARSW